MIFLAEVGQVTLTGQFRSVAQCFNWGIACGGTMNIADWLRALGLERYEAAFQENSVTALSSHLDPEDLSAVIRKYQATVSATIARFVGGFIANATVGGAAY